MNIDFNITEWKLKNLLKEGGLESKENTYAFITHVVNNLFPLNEYSDAEIKRLMTQFKEEADDLNITISDKELEAAIKRFDQLKNSPKITEKDLRKYSLAKLLKTVSSSEGAEVPESEESESGPDVIYSENGYTIYSGGNEELCQRHRNDVPWCITRTSFGNYRYSAARNYPSFYLVKNANLSDTDPLSFVAIQVRSDGNYVYTNRKNSPHESDKMSWGSLNQEIPWLQNIPNVKTLLRYVPLSSKEKVTQLYSKDSISFRDWENLPFNEKKQYLVIRKDKKNLFNDISEITFVEKYLPKYPQLATFIATNPDIIPGNLLLQNLDLFSVNDRKSITANFREPINLKELTQARFSFDVKKLLTKLNKWELNPNERLYVTKNGEAIVKLKFDDDQVSIGVFTEERDYPNIKLNQRTSKYLLDYPEIDKLPFPLILKLVNDGVVDTNFVNKILEKAVTDENSAIVIKDTDIGKIILDSNSFTSYKLENGRITSIPFNSEEVQNVLQGEELNTGFQKSAVDLVFKAQDLPAGIEKNSFLQILNNTPFDKRIGTTRDQDQSGVILVNNNSDRPSIFVIPSSIQNFSLLSLIDYGRFSSDWRKYDNSNSLNPNLYPLVIKYYKDTNQFFTDDQIKSILTVLQDKDRALAIVQSNPPMAPGSVLKPVIVDGNILLINSQNPTQSYIVSNRSGKLLNKIITPLQARRILNLPTTPQTPAPATPANPTAPETRRRGRPAGTTRPAAPAAPAAPAGETLNTSELFAGYGLQQAWNALSPRIRTALTNSVGIPTRISRGASRRNNMLGNRGTVVRVLEADRNSIYIIHLSNGRYIASINTQPGNGHLVALPNGTVLNIGSPDNLVSALTQNNLAEELSHVVVSEFLSQNPTMIDEAKNALRLILKNKK